MGATEPRDGSALCGTCGLCCSGVIFESARLGPDEVEPARRLRLPVFEHQGRAEFRLPCPRYEGSACGVYAERPTICRTFICHTLAAYLAGDIDGAAAADRIDRLRAAAARLRARLPEELRDHELWEAVSLVRFEGERSADPAAWRARHADLLLDVIEVEAICRRDFVDRDGR